MKKQKKCYIYTRVSTAIQVDGIDSSKDAGKLMISVLSAVAEIERENIRTQTIVGREQKAKDGILIERDRSPVKIP